MKLSDRELEKVVADNLTLPSQKGVVAYLGDYQFISKVRKKVFADRKNLLLSLKANLELNVKAAVAKRLYNTGITSNEIYRHPDYINAWENFMEQVLQSGFLRIVELQTKTLDNG